jgi:hypothetical protein
MIECVFTIDYEIYGNGEGSLDELIYSPAERLMAIFEKMGARLVVFVEVAELEKIESCGTDNFIRRVREQVREFHRRGSEIALHLHPQWYNARHQNGKWLLDYNEYNLCRLPPERITNIVGRSIRYLRDVVPDTDYSPFSFRAGNWLLQPSGAAADVLAKNGIRIDSSVFKGGLQHGNGLDYRRSLKNGHFWFFKDDVNTPESKGALLEVPIYTKMVPCWSMLTKKRVHLQRKSRSAAQKRPRSTNRFRDYLRFRYPLKFDFCRMTIDELKSTVDEAIREDQGAPESYRPLVAIGHTKDLVDYDAVEEFLLYLRNCGIRVSTLREAFHKCQNCT